MSETGSKTLASWTPGPWRFRDDALLGGPEEMPVLLAEANSKEVPWISFDEPIDKRLIEAAPEMAELLEGFASEGPDHDPGGARIEAARLLSRIRGES
jgi:hypothetical protein